MANILPLDTSRASRLGIGRTGIVLHRIKAAAGYRLHLSKSLEPVCERHAYKFSMHCNREILSEIKATNLVRRAFRHTHMLYRYTPLRSIAHGYVSWTDVKGHSSGIIHCLPMRRFKTDGYTLLLSAIWKQTNKRHFASVLLGVLFVYMRFLDVIHSQGLLHMDLHLQNSLFNTLQPKNVCEGVVCDFQGVCKVLDTKGDLYGDAWTTPLLAKCIPAAASQPVRRLWRSALGNAGASYTSWEACSSRAADGALQLDVRHRPYVDFHTLAGSLMGLGMHDFGRTDARARTPLFRANMRLARRVISCLIGDHSTPTHAVSAQSMFNDLEGILSPGLQEIRSLTPCSFASTIIPSSSSRSNPETRTSSRASIP